MRSRIVLAPADGLGNTAIAAKLSIALSSGRKWRSRFLAERLDGLLDEPRPGRPRTVADEQVEAVIVRTLETTPKDATHWSTRSLAAELGMPRDPRPPAGPSRQARHKGATTCHLHSDLQICRSVLDRKDVSLMVERALSTRSKGEPRLDIHNTNVKEDLAEAGLCGTVNLITGGVCRLPALHDGGCDFHRTAMPAPTV